jgi:hypothetical protein
MKVNIQEASLLSQSVIYSRCTKTLQRKSGIFTIIKLLFFMPGLFSSAVCKPSFPKSTVCKAEIMPLESQFISLPFPRLEPVLAEKRSLVQNLGWWAPHLSRKMAHGAHPYRVCAGK